MYVLCRVPVFPLRDAVRSNARVVGHEVSFGCSSSDDGARPVAAIQIRPTWQSVAAASPAFSGALPLERPYSFDLSWSDGREEPRCYARTEDRGAR